MAGQDVGIEDDGEGLYSRKRFDAWLPGKWSGSSKAGFVSSRLLESFHMTDDTSK